MDLLLCPTPLGQMALAAEGDALTRLYLPGCGVPRAAEHKTPLLTEAARQLAAYFSGSCRSFDLPLAPEGTAFQRSVWAALGEIPYGATRSYGDIARSLGRPKACRAVGCANHANPLPIFIPCHRVVGSNGRLIGYAGGLALKKALLTLEQQI